MTGVNFLVPVALAAGALLLALSAMLRRGHRLRGPAVDDAAAGSWLIHSINDDRCTGCEACVTSCPTQVLDLVDHKARVVRFDQCVQCEKCVWACPTRALVMHREGEQPPPVQVPAVDQYFQTPVPGQYLVGEAAARPLVKNGANLGRLVVEHMVATGLEPGRHRNPHSVDVAIVGSGPAGLSAALACIRRGLSYVVLEKDRVIASTISSYPRGKPFMAEPTSVTNLSYLPVFEGTKEQLLGAWQQLIAETRMNLRMGEAVDSVEPDGYQFRVKTSAAIWQARRVVLAIGVRGKPRRLGVPGEDLPHVAASLADPDEHRGRPVLVVGGGDVALEAAVALARAGARVTLSYRGKNFNRAQKRNRSAVEREAAAGRIAVRYQSKVREIRAGQVTLTVGEDRTEEIAAERVFVLIGADPPTAWLEKVGVRMVERPHGMQQPATDALIGTLVRGARPCPDDPVAAAAYVLRRPAPKAAPARTPARVPAPQLARVAGTPRPAPPKPRREGTFSGLLEMTTGMFRRVERKLERIRTPLSVPVLVDDFDDTTSVELVPPSFD